MGKLSIEEFAGGADRRCLVPSAGGPDRLLGSQRILVFQLHFSEGESDRILQILIHIIGSYNVNVMM